MSCFFRTPTRCSMAFARANPRISVSSGPGALDVRKVERTSMHHTCLRLILMLSFSSTHICSVRLIDRRSFARRSSASTRVMHVVLFPRQRSQRSSTRVDWSSKHVLHIPAYRRITSRYWLGGAKFANFADNCRHSLASDRLLTNLYSVFEVASSDWISDSVRYSQTIFNASGCSMFSMVYFTRRLVVQLLLLHSDNILLLSNGGCLDLCLQWKTFLHFSSQQIF